MPASKILIADDNQPNVELLEAYLAEVDCEIAVAADGHETLEKVAEFKPDLILLDIMMPKLSGFEVCRMLQGRPGDQPHHDPDGHRPGRAGRHRAGGGLRLQRFPQQADQQAGTAQAGGDLLELRHVTDEWDACGVISTKWKATGRSGSQPE